MQQGMDEAQKYLREATDLRALVGITASNEPPLHPLAQGEHNSNFYFVCPNTQQKAVLRLNYASQMGLTNQISYEYSALQQLLPSKRTPAPLFVDDSKSIIPRGVLVMEFQEGTHLEYSNFSEVQIAAEVLADIHSVKPLPTCALFQPKDPLREQFEECVNLFSVYRKWAYAENRVIDCVDSLLTHAQHTLDKAPAAKDCNHILNTEAVSDHFIFPSNPQNACMVDWEKPILGEVAQDVAYFLSPTTTIWKVDFIFDDEKRHAFVEHYWDAVQGRFSRDSFDERFAAYVMTNCLRGITWSAAAMVEYADPTRALKNADTQARLKLYLAPDFLGMIKTRFFA